MSITPGTMRLGVLAIMIGLVGAYGVQKVMQQEETPAAERPRASTPLVPLASSDLPAGRIVSLGDIALMPMTQQQMEERNYPLEKVMLSSEQIIGRRLKSPLALGQPFLTTEMFLEGQGPDISQLLQPGYRAVNVLVANERGGTVSEGDVVDVLFHATPREETETQPAIPDMTITLMERVEVLQVQRPQLTELQAVVGYVAKEPMITLAVTPEQAARLQAVQGKGDLALLTRSPNDLLGGDSKAITYEELFGLSKKIPDPQHEPFATEVYLGGSRQMNVFPRFAVVAQPPTLLGTAPRATGSEEPAEPQPFEARP